MKRIIIILSVFATMLPAQAQALRTCPAGYTPISHGCRTPAGNEVACDAGYQGTFRKVNGRWLGKCVAGPIAWSVQP